MRKRNTEKTIRPRIESITVLARLLDVEGFDDYAAGLCTRWWRKNRQRSGADKVHLSKQSITSILAKYQVTDEDKMILGKFIGLHKKIAFDSGFTIGLMTGIYKPPKQIKKKTTPSVMQRQYED